MERRPVKANVAGSIPAPRAMKGTMDSRMIAPKIVEAIENDFTDRRGLQQEWEQLDVEVKQEIRETWVKIVKDILEKA